MNIKCRGYEGTLIRLESCGNMTAGGEFHAVWYEVKLRTHDGATVSLSRVKEEEIEISGVGIA